MKLESVSVGFWGFKRSLKLDDRPFGDYQSKGWKEGREIALVDGRRLLLQREGWLGSQFSLLDHKDKRVLAKAALRGTFSRTWDLQLSIGTVEFKPQGWLSTAYQITQGSRHLAVLKRTGFFKSGWILEDGGFLNETDLLLVGLIFDTLQRRAAAAAA